ncbi:hypothetical protein [Streptomyces sp. NRRL F-4489]|uniref:hypothetical protein n=1 Tax=Streptomyces sp. NRRL F-4489 TaxID=1609095 RepID=UPI001F3C5316|nr:hypothetical protein [Streptomyces sp. NRRL F-4489]
MALALGAVLASGVAAGAADLGMILYTTPHGKKATLSQPLPGHCYTLAGSGSTANLSLVGKTAHFYAKPRCAGAPVADLGPGKRRDVRFQSLRLDAD